MSMSVKTLQLNTCSIVKEEISDDASSLPLVNGRVVAWVCLHAIISYKSIIIALLFSWLALIRYRISLNQTPLGMVKTTISQSYLLQLQVSNAKRIS